MIRLLVKGCLETGRFSQVIVALGSVTRAITSVLEDLPVETVEASDWPKGMSASLRAGIKQISDNNPDTEAAMLMPCDQPCLTKNKIELLADNWQASPTRVVAARYQDRPGAPVIFPRTYFEQLGQLHGDQGARVLLRGLNSDELLQVEMRDLAFDLDSPADLEKLQELSNEANR